MCTSHFIVRVRKGYSRFLCERESETEQKLQYFDSHFYGRQRCVFLVLQMLNRRPRALCWMMAFFTASYQQLFWSPNSIGVPEGPLGRVWLSLPQLIYNSVSNCNCNCHLTSVLTELYNSSTPTRSPLDLWNGMIDRHPAEITVMQFRGHSLPVRQSMRVSWNFFRLSHFFANFRPRDFLS